ncbi:Nif3-like dinuclear metal center hexameric protein [Glaciecola sp. 2405UD65-10]|uniref:Nif3-like dinuclear metal center hexameric protein n=1 Tax=Glaciecola sp. 2405UD65-10 TaxID=3397244 RepID=UPI003B5A171F
MLRNELLSALNNLLSASSISDFCPNGLQIEGRNNISKLVTGVTASEALIDQAILENADAILVHHGYFWKGESAQITGMKKRRIGKLLAHDINLLAYHLPIDVHASLGNNAQLGKMLQCSEITSIESIQPLGIVMRGNLPKPMSHIELKTFLDKSLAPNSTVSVGQKQSIRNIAWCTGGGQSYIDQVFLASQNTNSPIDAFISGEISEQTTHSANEQGIDFFAAGHHATERYGVKAVGEWVQNQYAIDVKFIDIPNPA